jgi:hypothetical protein
MAPFEKTYTNSRELFEDTWKYGTTAQKRALLKTVGAHPSFAVTKSPQEMVNRGGGLAVRSIGRVMDKFIEKNPGLRIKWV